MNPYAKYYILDRWEEGCAVIVGLDGKEVVLRDTPRTYQLGDAFELRDGVWTPVEDDREERQARIAEKKDKLFGK